MEVSIFLLYFASRNKTTNDMITTTTITTEVASGILYAVRSIFERVKEEDVNILTSNGIYSHRFENTEYIGVCTCKIRRKGVYVFICEYETLGDKVCYSVTSQKINL